MADVRFTVAGQSESATRIAIQVRDFTLVVDEPPSLGGDDQGANPVEYILASYVGCLNVMAHLIAAEQGIQIRSLRIEASGPLNPARLFGQPGDDRAGYKNIDVVFHVESDADERALATWLETIQARCPVHDNLTNLTPAQITLAPVRAAVWN